MARLGSPAGEIYYGDYDPKFELRDPNTGAINGWIMGVSVCKSADCDLISIRTDADMQSPSEPLPALLGARFPLARLPGGALLLWASTREPVTVDGVVRASVLRYEPATNAVTPVIQFSTVTYQPQVDGYATPLRDDANVYFSFEHGAAGSGGAMELYAVSLTAPHQAVRITQEASGGRLLAITEQHVVYDSAAGIKVALKSAHDASGTVLVPKPPSGSLQLAAVRGSALYYNTDSGAHVVGTDGAGRGSYAGSRWLKRTGVPTPGLLLREPTDIVVRAAGVSATGALQGETKIFAHDMLTGETRELGVLSSTATKVEVLAPQGPLRELMLSLDSQKEVYFAHAQRAGSLIKLATESVVPFFAE